MGWKTLSLVALALVVAAAWAGLVAGLAFDVPRAWKITLVIAAAVITEGAFWIAAAILGLSAFQARRQIWARLAKALGDRPDPKA